jgi:hypothetical protein
VTTTTDTPAGLRAERERLLARRPALARAAVHDANDDAAAELDEIDHQVAAIDRRLERLREAAAEDQRLAALDRQRMAVEAERQAKAEAARVARQWANDCQAWLIQAEAGQIGILQAKRLSDRAVANFPELRNVALFFAEQIAWQSRQAGLAPNAQPNENSLPSLLAAVERLAERKEHQ